MARWQCAEDRTKLQTAAPQNKKRALSCRWVGGCSKVKQPNKTAKTLNFELFETTNVFFYEDLEAGLFWVGGLKL